MALDTRVDMQVKNSRVKNGLAKTLLIILGVIIALLMTLNSPLFTAENLIQLKSDSSAELAVHPPASDEKENTSSSGSTYHSGARLFHVFTKNLPYLNNK